MVLSRMVQNSCRAVCGWRTWEAGFLPVDTLPDAVACRLRVARGTLGLTQPEMAALLRVKLRAYQLYESAQRLPQADSLDALCRLGISIDWLLTGEGEMLLGDRAGMCLMDWDDRLGADVAAGVADLYDDEGIIVATAELLRQSLRVYVDLLSAYGDGDERRVGLKLALTQLRRRLRNPS